MAKKKIKKIIKKITSLQLQMNELMENKKSLLAKTAKNAALFLERAKSELDDFRKQFIQEAKEQKKSKKTRKAD